MTLQILAVSVVDVIAVPLISILRHGNILIAFRMRSSRACRGSAAGCIDGILRLALKIPPWHLHGGGVGGCLSTWWNKKQVKYGLF